MPWWKDPQQLMSVMAKLADTPTGVAGAKGGGKGGDGKAGGKGGKAGGKGDSGSCKNSGWSQANNQHWYRWNQGVWQKWSCADPNRISALTSRGLKPWCNEGGRDTCEICGVHWNVQAKQKGEDMKLFKAEMRAQLTSPAVAQDDTVLEVIVEKTQDASGTWMGSDEEEEPTKTQLSLPTEYQAISRLLHGPRELTDQSTPAEKLNRFHTGKQSVDAEKLQGQLKDQQAFLELLEKKSQAATQQRRARR